MPMQFEPRASGYEPANALFLAKAAQLAYEDDPAKREEGRDELGLDEAKFMDGHSTQALIGTSPRMTLIAFRGTEPEKIEDSLTNAAVAKRPEPFGQVHTGFQMALNEVWERVQTAAGGEKPLWLTGHSLGAALATLATARLRLVDDRPVAGLYTFGSPRVGDAAFAAALDGDLGPSIFRFANHMDVVTRVPPRRMGYKHVGTLRMFGRDGHLDSAMAVWNSFLSDFAGDAVAWISETIHGEISNLTEKHSMDEYIRLLEMNATADPDPGGCNLPANWLRRMFGA